MSILVFASFFFCVVVLFPSPSLAQTCSLPFFTAIDSEIGSGTPYNAVECTIDGVGGPLAQFNHFCGTFDSVDSSLGSNVIFFTDLHSQYMVTMVIDCEIDNSGNDVIGVTFTLIKEPTKKNPSVVCQITQVATPSDSASDTVTSDSDGDSLVFEIDTVTAPPSTGHCKFSGISCQLVPSCKTFRKANGADDDGDASGSKKRRK